LTNRHLGKDYPIQCIGHADMVETQNGEWWMVTLGCRPYGGNYYNLARETFLVPMKWEDGWPVCAPGIGHVAPTHIAPKLPEYKFESPKFVDDFDSEKLDYEWNFLRIPRGDFWSLKENKGFLTLKLKPEKIIEEVNPAFIGRRQKHMSFIAETEMNFVPKTLSESAGLVIYQSPAFHYRMEVFKIGKEEFEIRLTECNNKVEKVIERRKIVPKNIKLKISAEGQELQFSYQENNKKEWLILAEKINGRILNRNTAGGFTGVYLGMYASSNGQKSDNKALFDYFEYKGL
jgi:xylan 1,4-beta-xylosidase